VQHAVAEDGVLVDHLHGDGGARLGIDGELDLGEAALPDGPAHLVPPHPLLPPAGARHSPLLGPPPPPDAALGVLLSAGACARDRRGRAVGPLDGMKQQQVRRSQGSEWVA
jgi:hypothetical protein